MHLIRDRVADRLPAQVVLCFNLNCVGVRRSRRAQGHLLVAMESDNAHAMMNEQRQQATATVVADMLAYDRELLELNWRAQTEGLPVESGVTHSSAGNSG